jgi:hypothetical protein
MQAGDKKRVETADGRKIGRIVRVFARPRNVTYPNGCLLVYVPNNGRGYVVTTDITGKQIAPKMVQS